MSRRRRVAYTPRGIAAGAGIEDSTELRAALNEIPFPVVGEVPTGIVNGTNAAFALAQPAQPGTLAVYADGKRIGATLGAGGGSFTAATPPTGTILVDYLTFGR